MAWWTPPPSAGPFTAAPSSWYISTAGQLQALIGKLQKPGQLHHIVPAVDVCFNDGLAAVAGASGLPAGLLLQCALAFAAPTCLPRAE